MPIYNTSSVSHKHILQRIEIWSNRLGFCRTFSASENVKILSVVEKMVRDDSFTYAEASTFIGIDQSAISRRRKNQEQLADVTRPDALSLHSGPINILKDIEGSQIDFVDEWHGKSLLVNRLTLM